MIIPADFTLMTNQVNRLPAEKTSLLIDALIDPKHKYHLTIRYNSGVKGFGRQWVEIRADNKIGSYTLVFGVKDAYVQQLWVIIAPSGACYCIDKEGPVKDAKGNHSFFTQDQQEALTDLLILPSKERKVIVTTYYKVEIQEGDNTFAAGAMFDKGSGGPKGLRFPVALGGYSVAFKSEEEANRVCRELAAYLADQSEKDQKTRKKEAKK